MSRNSAERAIVRAMMMGAVAMVFTSSLLLLWFLDHPYYSGSGLRPVAMERTLQLLQQERSRVTGVIVPCDSRGLARRP